MKKKPTRKFLTLFPFKDLVFVLSIFSLRGLAKSTQEALALNTRGPMTTPISSQFQFFYYVSGVLGMILMILASLKYYGALVKVRDEGTLE